MESMMRLHKDGWGEGLSTSRLVFGIGLVLVAVMVTACSKTPEECRTDTACKGERICSPEGRCVDPGAGEGAPDTDTGNAEGPRDGSLGDSGASRSDTNSQNPRDGGRPDVGGDGDGAGETGTFDTSGGEAGPDTAADAEVGDAGGCVPSDETCDGLDNDCDGRVDEDLTQRCGSKVGQCQQGTRSCARGSWGACVGQTQASPERCDGLDNDCDGEVDEGVKNTYFRDSDSDGFGASGDTYEACKLPSGYVANDRDCDDGDSEVNPTAREVCDGKDNDCSMTVDPGCQCRNGASRSCGTSKGVCQKGTQKCVKGKWGSCTGATMPGVETCNGKDDDCDGKVDESLTTVFYEDRDGDGRGDPNQSRKACSRPPGYVSKPGDSCDSDPNNWAAKACSNCADSDRDKHWSGCQRYKTIRGGDCNDSDPTVHRGAKEKCGNGKDEDCDGVADNGCPIRYTRQFGTMVSDDATAVAFDSRRGEVYVAGVTRGNLAGRNPKRKDAHLSKYTAEGKHQWSKQFGAPAANSVANVAVDEKSGAVYVVGRPKGSFHGQTNSGGFDGYLTKYGRAGKHLWTRLLGSSGYDATFEVRVDTGTNDVWVMGSTDGMSGAKAKDVFVANFSATGQLRTNRVVGSSKNDSAFGLELDSSSQVFYLTGRTYGAVGSGMSKGGADAFVAKYDYSGKLVWSHGLGSSSYDVGYSLLVHKRSVYAVGRTDGALEGKKNAGSTDGFVVHLDTSGQRKWLHLVGTPRKDRARDVGLLPGTGQLFLCGYTEGSLNGQTNSGAYDAFVMEMATNGSIANTVYVASSKNDYCWDLEADAQRDAVFIAGQTSGALPGQNNSGGSDAFFRRLR